MARCVDTSLLLPLAAILPDSGHAALAAHATRESIVAALRERYVSANQECAAGEIRWVRDWAMCSPLHS